MRLGGCCKEVRLLSASGEKVVPHGPHNCSLPQCPRWNPASAIRADAGYFSGLDCPTTGAEVEAGGECIRFVPLPGSTPSNTGCPLFHRHGSRIGLAGTCTPAAPTAHLQRLEVAGARAPTLSLRVFRPGSRPRNRDWPPFRYHGSRIAPLNTCILFDPAVRRASAVHGD